MSKIIEALEKAKREGRLESTVAALEERDTVVPLHPLTSAAQVGPRPERRRRSYSRESVSLDPRLLAGVDYRVEALHRPMSVVAEQYRQLRSRLERPGLAGEVRTLALTSAVKGEGKSVTALNLAVVMAQNANKDVILVDADFRRPNLQRLLNLSLGPGLSNHLEGGASREEVVRELPFYGLSVVTAGTVEGHPAELLASPEFADFIAWCRTTYHTVLIDTPPVHPISDVNFLVEHIDGVLLVVRAGKTSKELVQKAVESLPPGKVIGTVLNRTADLGHGYGYGKSGYGYYAGY